MVTFLEDKTEDDFKRYIEENLSVKYQQPITVEDSQIVSGLTGSDIVEEALIVRLFIDDSKTEWVEDNIIADINRFCFKEDVNLSRSIVLERDVVDGRIRYGIVYTDSSV